MPSIADSAIHRQLLSRDGRYEMLARKDWKDADYILLMLNDAFEYRIVKVLRETPPYAGYVHQWAQGMTDAIPGYQTWEEILAYTQAALDSPLEDPENPLSTLVGDERQLHALLTEGERNQYALRSWREEHDALKDEVGSLELASIRVSLLDGLRKSKRVPAEMRLLFRKIYYAYKLREALLMQIGYYNGSLELRAGLAFDFEYMMYLIQMKLRKPNRQHWFKAPKAMAAYQTYATSLLPWNNQFSFSYGFNEFSPESVPLPAANWIERELIRCIDDDARWGKLRDHMQWQNPGAAENERWRLRGQFLVGDQRTLTFAPDVYLADIRETTGEQTYPLLNLPALMARCGDEVRLKALFTLILGLTWSDEEWTDNPFKTIPLVTSDDPRREAYEIVVESVKSLRLAQAGWGLDLGNSRIMPNVVGRKANVLVKPEMALKDLAKKLGELSDGEFNLLYANIPDAPRPLTVDHVLKNARERVEAWFDAANKHRKPIYTGPSGHVLSYMNLYLFSLGPRGFPDTGPNLEEARLVLLAALLGANQHHSYDEVMTASHGISYGGRTLEYRDRPGYQDILTINGDPNHPIAQRLRWEAYDVAQTALASLGDKENFPLDGTTNADALKKLIRRGFATATGQRL